MYLLCFLFSYYFFCCLYKKIQVQYKDIRINREYIIQGNGMYRHWPRYIVRVLQQPPQPVWSQEVVFQVLILRILDIPFPSTILPSVFTVVHVGSVFRIRLSFWDMGDLYGRNWMFRTVELEPLPENIKAKTQVLNELKSIPSLPHFPGGSDFVTLAANRQKFYGGNTFFEPKLQ